MGASAINQGEIEFHVTFSLEQFDHDGGANSAGSNVTKRYDTRFERSSGSCSLVGCFHNLTRGGVSNLTADGALLFEHGYDQGEASRNLLTAAGFKAAFTRTDLAGIDRVSGGQRQS
jgi:methylase of polypeptide subunit release factors